MEVGNVLRIIIIITGVVLLCITVSSLAKRRMTEPFCLTWGLISIIIILAGVLLRPVILNRYISTTGMALVLLLGFCAIYGEYIMSARVSELMRRNLELAMQVSLLNQENEVIKKRLEELAEEMGQKPL